MYNICVELVPQAGITELFLDQVSENSLSLSLHQFFFRTKVILTFKCQTISYLSYMAIWHKSNLACMVQLSLYLL